MNRRERQKRRRFRAQRRRSRFTATFVVLTTVIGAGTVGILAYVLNVAASVPPIDQLKPVSKGTSSEIIAADGTRLGYIQSDSYRTPVPWSQLPKTLRDATVAIEDERFYKHGGVDYQGIVRAAVKNLTSGKTIQGGSTITMQLVRNTYISSQSRTLERKIKEAKLAQELERKLSKNQILERYINSVSYGTIGGITAIGAQAAAQTFFTKNARSLTLEEAALMAGLPQAPSTYNPFDNPRAALERRNEVIKAMADQGYISQVRAEHAYRAPLGLHKGDRYTKIREPYFFDYVKQQLIDRYGVNTVRKGGLKVYTTIDPNLQKAGRTSIDSVLNYPGDPSSAVVAIDPRNGYIKAMASSGTYKHAQFNLAGQGHRQPGSAFKPFALTTAIRRGIDPESTTYTSKPLHVPIPGYGYWNVSTYDNSYAGNINLVRATLRSDNSVFAQLALDLGPSSIADTAHEMGITTKLDGVPSETLGGLRLGVSPLEMADAYATLAAGGIHSKPIAITKVAFPDGRVEELGKPKRKRVFIDGVAGEVTKILEKNMQSGTATGANIGCPAAAKTGTTDNFNDAWLVGYTPRLSTAAWVGYPDALRSMTSVHGIAVAGGTLPADIWHNFMNVAKGSFCGGFPPPTTPVQFQTFYGKYGTQGKSSGRGGSYDTGNGYTEGTPGSNTTGGGGQGYDRRRYAPDPTGQLGKGKKPNSGKKPTGPGNGGSQQGGGTPSQ